MISGHKDTDLMIMTKMDDTTLFSFCKIENSYVQKLCNNENFWRERVKENFGNVKKNRDRTWKDLYLNIYIYKNKYGIYNSMIKLGMLGETEKNFDLFTFFKVQVLKRVYSKMIDMLRENLKAHRFTEKERYEYIEKHNLGVNKAAKEVLYMWFLTLKNIENHPEILRGHLKPFLIE